MRVICSDPLCGCGWNDEQARSCWNCGKAPTLRNVPVPNAADHVRPAISTASSILRWDMSEMEDLSHLSHP